VVQTLNTHQWRELISADFKRIGRDSEAELGEETGASVNIHIVIIAPVIIIVPAIVIIVPAIILAPVIIVPALVPSIIWPVAVSTMWPKVGQSTRSRIR
jgi:Flp pilus assembly protein TadB